MKNYSEITKSVLEKSGVIIARKKRNRNIAVAVSAALSCFCLAAGGIFMINNTPAVSTVSAASDSENGAMSAGYDSELSDTAAISGTAYFDSIDTLADLKALSENADGDYVKGVLSEERYATLRNIGVTDRDGLKRMFDDLGGVNILYIDNDEMLPMNYIHYRPSEHCVTMHYSYVSDPDAPAGAPAKESMDVNIYLSGSPLYGADAPDYDDGRYSPAAGIAVDRFVVYTRSEKSTERVLLNCTTDNSEIRAEYGGSLIYTVYSGLYNNASIKTLNDFLASPPEKLHPLLHFGTWREIKELENAAKMSDDALTDYLMEKGYYKNGLKNKSDVDALFDEYIPLVRDTESRQPVDAEFSIYPNRGYGVISYRLSAKDDAQTDFYISGYDYFESKLMGYLREDFAEVHCGAEGADAKLYRLIWGYDDFKPSVPWEYYYECCAEGVLIQAVLTAGEKELLFDGGGVEPDVCALRDIPLEQVTVDG